MVDKKTRRINYKPEIRQNAALPLNGMHLNIPSTECWTPVGPQAAQARPEWTMLMQGRSLLGQSSRYLAMMTRPVLTKRFKAWSKIVILIPVYGILISLQSRHLSAPNWHALNYWLAYTITDTYLLMVLLEWGLSPWNLGEIKKTYHVWSLENFVWIPQVSTELPIIFKLDLKKVTLTAFRTPVQDGLVQKVNIFCTQNEQLHAFYAPIKNRANWMRASC